VDVSTRFNDSTVTNQYGFFPTPNIK